MLNSVSLSAYRMTARSFRGLNHTIMYCGKQRRGMSQRHMKADTANRLSDDVV